MDDRNFGVAQKKSFDILSDIIVSFSLINTMKDWRLKNQNDCSG